MCSEGAESAPASHCPALQDELRKQGINDDEEQRLLSNLRVKVRGGAALWLQYLARGRKFDPLYHPRAV
jgi:hypothetical protein